MAIEKTGVELLAEGSSVPLVFEAQGKSSEVGVSGLSPSTTYTASSYFIEGGERTEGKNTQTFTTLPASNITVNDLGAIFPANTNACIIRYGVTSVHPIQSASVLFADNQAFTGAVTITLPTTASVTYTCRPFSFAHSTTYYYRLVLKDIYGFTHTGSSVAVTPNFPITYGTSAVTHTGLDYTITKTYSAAYLSSAVLHIGGNDVDGTIDREGQKTSALFSANPSTSYSYRWTLSNPYYSINTTYEYFTSIERGDVHIREDGLQNLYPTGIVDITFETELYLENATGTMVCSTNEDMSNPFETVTLTNFEAYDDEWGVRTYCRAQVHTRSAFYGRVRIDTPNSFIDKQIAFQHYFNVSTEDYTADGVTARFYWSDFEVPEEINWELRRTGVSGVLRSGTIDTMEDLEGYELVQIDEIEYVADARYYISASAKWKDGNVTYDSVYFKLTPAVETIGLTLTDITSEQAQTFELSWDFHSDVYTAPVIQYSETSDFASVFHTHKCYWQSSPSGSRSETVSYDVSAAGAKRSFYARFIAISADAQTHTSEAVLVQYDYLYLENVDSAAGTLTLENMSGKNVEYSTDRINWTTVTFSSGRFDLSVGVGQKVYLRGTNNAICANSTVKHISADFNHNIGGNICSLLNKANFDTMTTISANYALRALFYGDGKLVDASAANLGNVNRLVYWTLESAFRNCTSMVYPPDFTSVTDLGESGMAYICAGCTSLVEAPNLGSVTNITDLTSYCSGCTALTHIPDFTHAVSIASGAFSNAWKDCTALVTPPDFPLLETISSRAFASAFQFDTALETAPQFPSLTKVDGNGFFVTFYGCTSLVEGVDVRNVTELGSTPFTQTYYDCSSLETVYAPNVAEWNQSDFSNWLYHAGTGVAAADRFMYAPNLLVDLIPSGSSGYGNYHLAPYPE